MASKVIPRGPELGYAPASTPEALSTGAESPPASATARRSLISVRQAAYDVALGVLSAGAAVATVVAPEVMLAGPDEALAGADTAALAMSAAVADPAAAASISAEASELSTAATSAASEAEGNAALAAGISQTSGASAALASGAEVPAWFGTESAWTSENTATAATALQKHGDRFFSLFPKIANKKLDRPAQARELIKTILNDLTTVTKSGNSAQYGEFVDVISNSGEGLGVRYAQGKGLVGLLEPGFTHQAKITAASGLFT